MVQGVRPSSARATERTHARTLSDEELRERLRVNKLFADVHAFHERRRASEELCDQQARQAQSRLVLNEEAHRQVAERMYGYAYMAEAKRHIQQAVRDAKERSMRQFVGRPSPPVHRQPPPPPNPPARHGPTQPSLTVDEIHKMIERMHTKGMASRKESIQKITRALEATSPANAQASSAAGQVPPKAKTLAIFAHATREETEACVARLHGDASERARKAEAVERAQQCARDMPDPAAETNEYHHTRWPHSPPRKLPRRPEREALTAEGLRAHLRGGRSAFIM